MSASLTSLRAMYDAFTNHVDDMLDACKKDDVSRKKIQTQYEATQHKYDAAINKVFHDNDPAVLALVTQATTVTGSLNTIGTQLGNIAKVIDIATQAATIAGKFAAV